MFHGRARAARFGLVDGAAGLVWAQGGKVRVVFRFEIGDGRVVGIEQIADAGRIAALAIEH